MILYVDSAVLYDPNDSITVPSTIEYYAYMEPLKVVGINTLLYNTHRDDHSTVALYETGGAYYLAVNDPNTPSTSALYHDTMGLISGGSIFDTTANVNSFYELSYNEIATYVTNVIVKVDMHSDGVVKPVLRSYELRAGDDLKL